ncbi:MAG TPA: secondary thiamine-phosphate synthase enzyme YjbQ [Anaerolineaceae bacterium]|nr:secondary thiamine-phosphate synthase enzyme YjbQ [Anaerolineaceae bacterium]HPN51750.1 secondary thiamine-phosphate synthase enzyme YjbQ [Anaerolineaceae bacterium]
MVKTEKVTLLTEQYHQMIVITPHLRAAVAAAGVQNGLAAVITLHTTTGISVNEALECLESDIDDALKRLVPEDHPYAHARILPSYGSTAGNPTGHIKSMLTGNHCLFPVSDGQLVMGEAQEVYFYEFDGPARRTVTITVMGEA